MTRRAERRRRDIQRELMLGPATVRELARALRRPRLLLWDDLEALQDAGNVGVVWIQRPGWPDGALVAAYRLLTIAEQDNLAVEQAAFEQRIRAALAAAANHITIPGEPS